MPEPLLSFEVDGEVLHVVANPAGIRRLSLILERLSRAAERGINEDAHLFAESWGGHDLHESPLMPQTTAIKQVNFRVHLDVGSPSDAS